MVADPLGEAEPSRLAWVLSWPVLIVLFCAPGVLWALASPLFSVPDEPSHAIKAAAIWHGQLGGEDYVRPSGHITTVFRLPAVWADAHRYPECYAFRANVTADCSGSFDGPTAVTGVDSTAGHYPPLFYALVGWPARLSAGPIGVYLMRITSAVLCGVLLAAAVKGLARAIDPRLAVSGILAASVPMVYFLAGSVNPSGLEIAAAIAVWATALAILNGSPSHPPRSLILQLVVAIGVMAFSRPLAPILAIGVVALAAVSVPPVRLRSLVRDRATLIGLGVAAGLVIIGGLSILLSGALGTVPGSPVGENRNVLLVLIGQSNQFVRQMIGVFGWLDTPVPAMVDRLWMGTVLGLLAISLVLLPLRRSIAALLTVLATVVLPIAAQYPSADTQGLPWQGRYSLPIAVGIPLLAVVGIDRSSRLRADVVRRLGLLTGTATGSATFIAFFWALRRYTTGIDGRFKIFRGVWQPPGGSLVLLTGMALVVASSIVLVLGAGGPARARREDDSLSSPGNHGP